MDFGGEPTTTTLLNSIILTYICRGMLLRMFECFITIVIKETILVNGLVE